ncbi:MAG: LamG-like jellyroll fold domain-containing protein [Chthoniobacteraceae bacterium]
MNLASNFFDNMVFGGNGTAATPANQVLHLGTRNGNVQSGHWGDDVGPDHTLNIPVPNNQWHVIAFTNDGATGLQTIYIDPGTTGEISMSGGSPNNTGGMDRTINLLIGTAANGGSFNGQLDRITAYDTLRTPAQLAAAATAAPVPEPTAFLAVASGTAMLLGLRRRRS